MEPELHSLIVVITELHWATMSYTFASTLVDLQFCFTELNSVWKMSCVMLLLWVGGMGGSVNGFKVPPHWQTSLYCFRILYTISLQTVGILENSGIILMPLCEVGPLNAILRTSWSLYCNSGSVIRVLSISLFHKIFFHICVRPNCLFLRQMDDILMQPIWASTNPIWAHSRSQRIVLEQGAPHF